MVRHKKDIGDLKEIAEFYLVCKSLYATGKHFNIAADTVKSRMIEEGALDNDLQKKVLKTLKEQSTHGKINRREEKSRSKIKKHFDKLDREISKKRLIDWYCTTPLNQCISINQLVELAQKYGVKVI